MIRIKTKFEELTLGDLVSLASLFELDVKENKTHEDLIKQLEYYADYIGVSVDLLTSHDDEEFGKITKAIEETMPNIIHGYMAHMKKGKAIQVFDSLIEEKHIIEANYLTSKNKFLGRRTKDRLYKAQKFYIPPNIGIIPAQIFILFLDNDLKRHDAITEEFWWRKWLLIPGILAKVAWRKNEKMVFSKREKRFPNLERIQKMERVFKDIPATTALSAYRFFLFSYKNYLLEKSLEHSKRKLNTQSSNLILPGKPTMKSGGIMVGS